ncbi:MAG: DMT family transporter [Bacteroidetes bacterium]|nr:DMT family transporter [Bacteroidota bacterium]
MKKSWWPAALILLLGCIWGSSFILIKRGLLAFEPVQVAGWRLFLAGLILTPWVIRYSFIKRGVNKQNTHNPKLLRKDYINLFLSGLLGNGIPAFLFSYAGTRIPSGLSGILNAFTPMFTLLVGIWLFRDRLTRNGFLGVLCGISGAIFLFGPAVYQALSGGSGAQADPLSIIMVLFAALLYGYNINLIKHRLHHLPGMIKTAYPFFFMGILCAFILGGTRVDQAWVADNAQAWKSFGFLCILGVLGSAVSMILFNYLIRYTSALVASTNTFIIPVVAVMWGLFDKETLTWNMFVGLLLSLGAVYLIMRKDNHPPRTADDMEELKEFTE